MPSKSLPFKVVADSPIEQWRVDTFWTKEPGTIDWLNALHSGDVLIDVGANIGLYSLYAASRVKHVYAIEPHIMTAQSLLRNVAINNWQDKITVLTTAVGGSSALVNFYYRKFQPGSSGHQCQRPLGEDGAEFEPVAIERKQMISVGDIISCEEPSVAIKIDVDGLELDVLRGCHWLFRRKQIKSLQVEIHPHTRDDIASLLRDYGWWTDRVHYTSNGQKAISQGADPETLACNYVFERIGSTA